MLDVPMADELNLSPANTEGPVQIVLRVLGLWADDEGLPSRRSQVHQEPSVFPITDQRTITITGRLQRKGYYGSLAEDLQDG
jgi:hypothetical protein